MVIEIYNPSYSGGRRRIMSSRATWVKLVRSYLKIKTLKKARDMAQMVEPLPSKPQGSGFKPPHPQYHRETEKENK
jgi:hypothetical protein